MSFLYPLGLLGLIGIPILILVYIIKSKYAEQTVASTYLWTLSERFLKRKKRVSRLTGIISLILQLLAVTVISLLIAHPIITIPNSANEYCFILDGSGSMRMSTATVADTQTGTAPPTRFEAGKQAISDMIDNAVDGSRFTLVYMGDDTSVIFSQLEDKEQAHLLLNELEPAYATISPDKAVDLAQEYFDENRGLLTYLVTDTSYETAENIEIVRVAADPVENYAVSDVVATHRANDLTVTGNVTSYTNDASLTVELYIDDAAEPADRLTVSVKAGVPAAFTLSAKTEAYASLTVKIPEADALALDNQFVMFDVSSENSYNTLIISERPFFIESALRSLLNAKIDVVEPKDYTGQTGYGLYVFDTVDPSTMSGLPTDGTVWLLNVAGSVEGSGYTVQGEVILEEADLLTHATSSSSATQKLVEGMKKNDIFVTRYIKCGFYRSFTTLLSYGGYPVVFAGSSENGNREVVFAFDIHDSNLPLLYDFAVLMRNLVAYSFPDMVNETTYACGEAAEINVLANCTSIRVESPSGGVTYLDTSMASDSVTLREVGVYTVDMTVAGSAREFCIWSALSPEERVTAPTAPSVRLLGEASPGGFDGRYDPLTALFIALAVLFLADWMVYCYEKYQLR